MVAIPELDGAAGPMVYRRSFRWRWSSCTGCERACTFARSEIGGEMHVCSERADMLASRTAASGCAAPFRARDRKVAIVLFNFPPNAGNTGTAAFLSVFESLHRTLTATEAGGLSGRCAADADALRERIVVGNAARFGADANVHVQNSGRRSCSIGEKWLRQIEAQWGPAPGKTTERRQFDLRAGRALRKRLCRHPARLRI